MASILKKNTIGNFIVITEHFGNEHYETRIVNKDGRVIEREMPIGKSEAIAAHARYIMHVRYNLS